MTQVPNADDNENGVCSCEGACPCAGAVGGTDNAGGADASSAHLDDAHLDDTHLNDAYLNDADDTDSMDTNLWPRFCAPPPVNIMFGIDGTGEMYSVRCLPRGLGSTFASIGSMNSLNDSLPMQSLDRGLQEAGQILIEAAINYFNLVKNMCADKPKMQAEFIDLMQRFVTQRIGTMSFIYRLSVLFRDRTALLSHLNIFLPAGLGIETLLNERGMPVPVLTMDAFPGKIFQLVE